MVFVSFSSEELILCIYYSKSIALNKGLGTFVAVIGEAFWFYLRILSVREVSFLMVSL